MERGGLIKRIGSRRRESRFGDKLFARSSPSSSPPLPVFRKIITFQIAYYATQMCLDVISLVGGSRPFPGQSSLVESRMNDAERWRTAAK